MIHSYQNGCSWDRANRGAKSVSTHAWREFVHSVEPNWDSQRWAECRYVCYLCTRETRRVSGPVDNAASWLQVGKASRATETDSGRPVEQQLGATGPRPLALLRCMRGQGSLLRTSERSATLTSVPACTGAEFGLSTHDSRAWEGHGRVAAGPVVVIVTGPRVRRHTAARRERHASQARRVLGGACGWGRCRRSAPLSTHGGSQANWASGERVWKVVWAQPIPLAEYCALFC